MPGEVLTDKTAEEKQEETGEQTKKEAPASRAVVGIIYPPPEVRNIVDKTADFVARNGPEFEERIKLNEAGNPKFNFLGLSDPYHTYYEHKIKEIKEGVAQEMAAAAQQQQTPMPKAPAMLIAEPETPKEPPPDWEYITDPPSISATEIDIVKLTAQFVARNGAQFLDKLMMREQRNYQFDFLRKQHPLFAYFTKLVEQYSKVFIPQKATLRKINNDIENPIAVLERSRHRVEWEQFIQKQRRRVEEREEKERVEYAQIDWHDFVMVETINFKESEAGYLPPPIRPSQLAQRLLQQQKYERLADDAGEVQEIEMEVEEQDDQPSFTEKEKQMEDKAPPPRPPAAPTHPPPASSGPVQIRKDYNPKMGVYSAGQAPPSGQFLISPITGEKIPAEKMQEHMRYGLLDPRWIEEQKRQVSEKKTKEEVYAEGFQIGSNLKRLADRRTDIFGAEETVIGRKIGEDESAKRKQLPTVQWDGHSASAESATRQAHVNIAEQLEVIQKAKEKAQKEQLGPSLPVSRPATSTSFPPPPPSHPSPLFPMPHQGMLPRPIIDPHLLVHRPPQMMPHHMQPNLAPPIRMMSPNAGMMQLPNSAPPVPGMPPPMAPPPFPHLVPDMGPPVTKKPRSEAEELVPEEEYSSRYPGPVTFQVQAPNIPDRGEWNLKGQITSITLPITDSVSVIKAKISDELGMPTGKQKLQIGTIFIKDSNSLAYYNFSTTTTVLLGLKERGGRRK